MPKIEIVPVGAKDITLTDYVEGSVKVAVYYSNGATGQQFAMNTAASATEFAIDGEGKLTLPTITDSDITELIIVYKRKVSEGLVVENYKMCIRDSYNVELTTAADNGNLIARGDWVSLDLYKEAAVTTFEGVVQEQAANGNWYVEVTNPGDALFVYQQPVIAEESTNTCLLYTSVLSIVC